MISSNPTVDNEAAGLSSWPNRSRFPGLAARAKAAAVSASATAFVAACASALVFLVWYPSPFREISGGLDLLAIVVGADLVLGPLITFCVFDRRKARPELLRDMLIVVTMQLAGLAYGLHALYIARPAALALERDRVRVVRAADLDEQAMARAPAGLRHVPLWGQLIVAAVDDPADNLRSVQLAMAGLDIGQRPERWVPPEQTAELWLEGSRPIVQLLRRYPNRKAGLEAAIAATRLPMEQVRYLPLLARRTDWIVLIDAGNGKIVGYAQFDGF